MRRHFVRLSRAMAGSIVIMSAAACSRGESAPAVPSGTPPAQKVAEMAKPSLVQDTAVTAAVDESVKTVAENKVTQQRAKPGRPKADTAMFAGGCFWSMERPFQHVPGVIATIVGYAGGHTQNPTYEQVNTRTTGHTETVQVEFDPSKVTYAKLLDVYWHNIDPVTKDRQFCDGGSDYRTVIFTRNAGQSAAANASKKALDASGHFKTPIVTEIVANAPFWRGEEYHQHFADRNPDHYNSYKRGCGRDARLRELWGDSAAPYVPKA